MPYDPNFINGIQVPLPTLTQTVLQETFNAGQPVDHTNFSLVFNQIRGFAVYSAHNIDGDNIVPDLGRHGFTLDPLVQPRSLQVNNDRGYRGFPTEDDNPWDRGHLARRRALHWPDHTTADRADRESSHYTNIAPQHRRLNQGPWSDVEDFILGFADANNRRACVFTGPVFTESDVEIVNMPGELPIRIPAGFWKIAAICRNNSLVVVAFLLWQRDIRTGQPVQFDPVLEQVRCTTIEYLAGLHFDNVVRNADPLRFRGPNAVCVVDGAGDVVV